MARTTYELPFAEINGRIDKNSQFYYCTRMGTKIVSHYPLKKDPKKLSANQKACFSNFAEAVQQTKIELADPERRAYWQHLFDEQKKTAEKPYRILRNFVIASLTKFITT